MRSTQQEVKPTKQQRKAARMLAHGASFMDALTAAGYSRAQARKGLARVKSSKGLMVAVREEMTQYPPELRADLVRLRLLDNLISGRDVATRSARLLGADKEVAMWQEARQDQQVLIIQPPADWKPSREPPSVPSSEIQSQQPAAPKAIEDELPEYE